MDAMPDSCAVSVVVCSRFDDRQLSFWTALRSVLSQEPCPLEVIAVVDHNDALRERTADAIPEALVLANAGRPGLSGARNTGIAHARGDIVAFIDDDATAEDGWLRELLALYGGQDILGVGGRIAPDWPAGRPAWFPDEFDWVVGCSYRGMPTTVARVRNLLGCNMSFRRSVFDRVGGFNEALGRLGDDAAGCEETELCIRAAEAIEGGVFLFAPDAVVTHHVSMSRTRWRYFIKRCVAEGRSKAAMVGRVGQFNGLSAERGYAARVLPAGVGRGISSFASEGDWSGLAKAAAIVSGLAAVSTTYFGRRFGSGRRRASSEAFKPIHVAEWDIADVPPALVSGAGGRAYGGALVLVRDAKRPIKTVELSSRARSQSPEQLLRLIGNDIRLERTVAEPTQNVGPLTTTVVVATRDRPAALRQCLDSLLSQDYGPFDVVVVDNAPSSADTRDLVVGRYESTGRVRYVREDRAGLGHAHNRGVADLGSDIAAFTDDDVIVDRHWLSAIASGFNAGEGVGCVTGLILPVELETRAQYLTEKHGGFGKGFERRTFDLGANRPEDKLFPYSAGMMGSGANMAFSAAALRAIGGFDSALGAGTRSRGGDDLAAFASVIQAGFQLVYEPGALVWHRHRREMDGLRRQAFGYGVGLGAYLTKLIVDRPAVGLDLARAFPSAIWHVFSRSSPKNKRLPHDYPTSLIWLERFGVVAGVPAYFRSRVSLRRYLRGQPNQQGALSNQPDLRRG